MFEMRTDVFAGVVDNGAMVVVLVMPGSAVPSMVCKVDVIGVSNIRFTVPVRTD